MNLDSYFDIERRVASKRIKREKLWRKKYYQRPDVKIKIREGRMKRAVARKIYNNNYQKFRRSRDSDFLIKGRVACSLDYALNTFTKTGKIMASRKYGIDYKTIIQKLTPLPFPIEDRRSWHIDHIIPVSKFNLTNSEEVRRAFAPDNLQWLPAIENIRKGNRV